ncbi:MAG: hypothetical protein IJT98_02750 [Prevotella sp.]|nr:hypothetical protein [Prevotella sp.]
MKRLHLLLLSVVILPFLACGDDGNDDAVVPSVNITLLSQSIDEGALVNAATTTVLTLSYSNTVAVSPDANITLNGTKLTASNSATTKMMVDIPLALQPGTAYTLVIPAGSIVSTKDAAASAPAFTLHFKTKERGAIPETPVTASTYEARRLYSFFLDNYGRKTVSSVMADVNWNNNCAEKVYSLTGKHPAMNCYDFIHICYSAPGSWINYNDLKPVQDWVGAGGLVQLMWHFNVPKSEGSTDYSFYSDENNFKGSNALVSGTWENKWFYEQMDQVIGVVLKLQQAGIAATWRPFHEAAGNATAKQQANWTKAWFWWGSEGAEVYKQLWHAMFDYFKQKGVNNLIWVWTTQNFNGNSQQYVQDTDWYPGNDYCDMVARDLYGIDAAGNALEFQEIQAAYPTKMVALGECGRGSNEAALMGQAWAAGALWSHFMVWCDKGKGSTDTMCSDDWWRAAMTDEHVITREDLTIDK